MRHKKPQDYAFVIDDLVDHYMKTRGGEKLPNRRLLSPIVELMFEEQEYLGRGASKRAFKVLSRNGKRELVLKIGEPKSIKNDWKVYVHAKNNGLADRYFAKCYWHTKYCMLQKFGEDRKVPPKIQRDLKERANKIGLQDIGLRSNRNIRYIDGYFRIIDASFSSKD